MSDQSGKPEPSWNVLPGDKSLSQPAVEAIARLLLTLVSDSDDGRVNADADGHSIEELAF